MKCIFIYNPVGGKGEIASRESFIVKQLRKKYEIVDVYATKCAGDMTHIARVAATEYDAIIFAGGDGSFNEILQGIGDMEDLPVLGYIPSGTVNDVAHSLKIPRKLKSALKVILEGQVEQIDCMKVNEKYAIYVAAAGTFTSATYTTSQKQKNHIGKIAYGIEGLKNNLQYQAFRVHCRGEGGEVYSENCMLIAFINSKYVAGFQMNSRADLQDGEMEMALVEQRKKPNIFKRIGGYIAIAGLFLIGYRVKNRQILRLKGKSFDVDVADDIVWNLDGEKGSCGKIHIEVLPKRVKILLPNKK